jgi:hypothetical protein
MKDKAIKPNKQIDIDTQLPIGISCSERKTSQKYNPSCAICRAVKQTAMRPVGARKSWPYSLPQTVVVTE